MANKVLTLSETETEDSRIINAKFRRPQLEELVNAGLPHLITKATMHFFERFHINADFVRERPSSWPENINFQKALRIVKSLKVVNDVPERGVKLITDFNNLLTKEFMSFLKPDHMDNDVNQNDKKVKFEPKPLPKIIIGKATPTKRKFSLSASLHANLLGVTPLKNDEAPANFNTRRRFSNVGEVVTRKLSTSIGWRSPTVPPDEVIAQGRVLCGQYIRNRLKRSGIFSKKLGLYRLRSMVGTTSAIIVREVFPSLICAGTEIERLYPKLYTNVARQASLSPGGVLVSDKAAAALLSAIGHDLFKADITWGKVVSIFAVAGGLAVDCVCQGHPEYLHGLMEGMVEVLEDSLADWIAINGGWTSLSNQCRSPDEEISLMEYASIFLMALIGLLVAYSIILFFWEFLFPTKKMSVD